MAKYLGDEKGKPQPKGESGTGVQSGLSEHQKFDSDKDIRTASNDTEQARSRSVTSSAGGGFTFMGNN